jgi:hypothetical protein
MEQKTRLSGRVAARITSRGPALGLQEQTKSPLRYCLQPDPNVIEHYSARRTATVWQLASVGIEKSAGRKGRTSELHLKPTPIRNRY